MLVGLALRVPRARREVDTASSQSRAAPVELSAQNGPSAAFVGLVIALDDVLVESRLPVAATGPTVPWATTVMV